MEIIKETTFERICNEKYDTFILKKIIRNVKKKP